MKHKFIKRLSMLGLLFYSSVGMAADFDVGVSREGNAYIVMVGEINENDGARFRYLVNTWTKKGNPPTDVILNLRGGLVYEGYDIMNTVLEHGMMTIVGNGDQCSSACVAILAAGQRKYIEPGAHIGVHRASMEGEDSDAARAASIAMVKVYKDLNIPERIRLKMVETDPDDIYYLTQREMVALSQSRPNYRRAKETIRTANVPVRTYPVAPNNRQQARDYNEQGIFFIQQKEYYRAVNSLIIARNLAPTDAEILGNLGYAYYMNGQYNEAKASLTASLQLHPKRGSSWNNLGLVLVAMGDIEWATDCFVNYWSYSSNKRAATNQFFIWEAQRPGTALDIAAKQARHQLGITHPVE